MICIENEKGEKVDRLLRKYITYNCIPVVCVCPEILLFYSDKNINQFYFNAKKMITKTHQKETRVIDIDNVKINDIVI